MPDVPPSHATPGPGPASRSGEVARPAVPLSGLRGIALEQAVAAPLCSRHLADLGADVIKVKRPDRGDMTRGYDSVVQGQSAYFVWANRGKRSLTLDLKSDHGRRMLGELLDGADVFLHNLGPGAMERLGFGREAVSTRWPALINCAISGYGNDGPYQHRKAFDLLIQGEAGMLSLTGKPDAPAKVGISIADTCAAMYPLSAVLAALIERDRSGRGTFIDISMLECLAEWMMTPAYHQLHAGRQPRRAGARHNMLVPYGVYRAGNGGHVNLAVQTQTQWRRLCAEVLDQTSLIGDPRFATNEARVRNRDELEALIEERFHKLDPAEVTRLLADAGIPTGDVNDSSGAHRPPPAESALALD